MKKNNKQNKLIKPIVIVLITSLILSNTLFSSAPGSGISTIKRYASNKQPNIYLIGDFHARNTNIDDIIASSSLSPRQTTSGLEQLRSYLEEAQRKETAKIEKNEPLLKALTQEDIRPDAVARALAEGADPNAINCEGDTALSIAQKKYIKYKYTPKRREPAFKAIKILIEAGADVTKPWTGARTLNIHSIAAGGHLDVLKLLLTKNKEQQINAQDDDGRTPLHYAVSYPDVINYLLQQGADPCLRDHNQQDALQIAKSWQKQVPATSIRFGILNKSIKLLEEANKGKDCRTSRNFQERFPEIKELSLDNPVEEKPSQAEREAEMWKAILNWQRPINKEFPGN